MDARSSFVERLAEGEERVNCRVVEGGASRAWLRISEGNNPPFPCSPHQREERRRQRGERRASRGSSRPPPLRRPPLATPRSAPTGVCRPRCPDRDNLRLLPAAPPLDLHPPELAGHAAPRSATTSACCRLRRPSICTRRSPSATPPLDPRRPPLTAGRATPRSAVVERRGEVLEPPRCPDAVELPSSSAIAPPSSRSPPLLRRRPCRCCTGKRQAPPLLCPVMSPLGPLGPSPSPPGMLSAVGKGEEERGGEEKVVSDKVSTNRIHYRQLALWKQVANIVLSLGDTWGSPKFGVALWTPLQYLLDVLFWTSTIWSMHNSCTVWHSATVNLESSMLCFCLPFPLRFIIYCLSKKKKSNPRFDYVEVWVQITPSG